MSRKWPRPVSQTFAGGVGVGGGYVDTLEVGTPVTVGGVIVHPGDLIHADRHGVVKVPLDLAPGLPDAIRAHADYESGILDVCRSPDFTHRKAGRGDEAKRLSAGHWCENVNHPKTRSSQRSRGPFGELEPVAQSGLGFIAAPTSLGTNGSGLD